MVACGVTVLRTADGKRSTKLWRRNVTGAGWTVSGYGKGYKFIPAEHEVSCMVDVASVIEAHRKDQTALIVRGALTPAVRASIKADPRHQMRRLKDPDYEKGDPATLVDVARSWLPVDVDKFKLRPTDDVEHDLMPIIDRAISECLPEPFHDARCFFQLSSSAGFLPGMISVHLFFWLSHAVTSAHAKEVMREHARGIDLSIYGAAQQIYIADPVIEGGYDPVPRRTGRRDGMDDAVTLPALRTVERTAYSAPSSLSE